MSSPSTARPRACTSVASAGTSRGRTIAGPETEPGRAACRRPRHDVVDAERARGIRIGVEGGQVRIEPVGASRARDHRKVRRRDAEPLPGRVGPHRDAHGSRDLVRRIQEVLAHLLGGQAEIASHSLIAKKVERVATQAVVHVNPGAALQRCRVLDIDSRGKEVETAARAPSRCRPGRQQQRHHQPLHHVTLSGSTPDSLRRVCTGSNRNTT